MKKDFTRVAIILDRSGSMSQIAGATIAGFNEFVNTLKQVEGETTIKLVQFDNIIETVFDKPLADVPPLTNETFVPRDYTALNDAMGRTINALGTELAALPEDARPAKVMVLVLTDGFENCSHEFSRAQVAEMVKHQREKYSWEFVFMGANQDAVLTAQTYNIPRRSSMTYAATASGTASTFGSAAMYVNSVRNINFDGGELARSGFTEEQRKEAEEK